ncbi:Alpha-mannosidase 2 [Echinococcus granulosus]|uniref:mannosyl-oligosaccharide 1,3-1,6-alpha-mannosidase n=3 Tax=Echinococcus granulosus TaxID=6210 RepID=W6U7B9_ECHGR|nr:Alpha-mannosidase 2 [Echinococcus granulosus]EUB56256.1 Alpha-mannosidase 2 [Echinococcus granulosus]
MFMRRPLRRFAVICGVFFVITLLTYFYATRGTMDMKILQERVHQFNKDFAEKLRVPVEVDVPHNIVEQKELKCDPQVHASRADIETGPLYDNIPFKNEAGGVWKQGFNISYSPSDWNNKKLEVLVLPHSHQDPGWLMTLNEYFEKSTHRGLDATVDFLGKNSFARFIYAEVAYLDRWWKDLSPSVRTLFTKLVRDGQWEIATGGWVVHDEALTHYGAAISQLIEGQHWMLDNLGVVPNVSWAIDVFGHSTTATYILRKAGIKNALIHRVHYEVKKALAKKQNLEFIWRQSWDSSGETEVFVHLTPFFSYDIPHTCGPDPSICCQFDFIRNVLGCPWGVLPTMITPSNVQARAEVLVDQYRKKAKLFSNGDVLLVPLGDDFRYLTLAEWDFQVSNYQMLMDHINSKASYNMHIRFGTLSEYFDLVHSRSKLKEFSTFIGDFYTYADLDDDFWSGYYTSHASFKSMARFVEAEVRNADILFSIASHWSAAAHKFTLLAGLYDKLTVARRNLALFQHHDALPGTAKSHVMADYHVKLDEAIRCAQNVSAVSVAFLLGYESPEVCSALGLEASTGTSSVLISANPIWGTNSTPELFTLTLERLEDTKTLYLFNSLPRARDHVLRLRVNITRLLWDVKLQVKQPQTISISVQLENGITPLSVQLEPWDIFRKPGALGPLFHLSAGPIHLEPLEVVRVTLKPVSKASQSPAVIVVKPTLYRFVELPSSVAMFYAQEAADSLVPKLKSNLMELTFDRETGFSQAVLNKGTGESHKLAISIEMMKATSEPTRAGAYIGASFATKEPLAREPLSMRVLRGSLTEEVTTYYPQVKHTLRIHKLNAPGNLAVEVENIANLTDVQASVELVMVIQTGIQNTKGIFFTDSNCYQMIQRKYYAKIRQWGNIYPMTCAAYIEDGQHRVTLLSGQSVGVLAGENPGEIKVWLDRKVLSDDHRGLNEPLINVKPSRSVFSILVERMSQPVEALRGGVAFVPSLTAEAHYVQSDLTFPAAQFLTNFDPSRLVVNRQLMESTGLPCDCDLVTLKTFFSKSERYNGLSSVPGSQLGVILHRTVHACGATYLCDSACDCSPQDESSIRWSLAFPQLIPKMAVRTPVTLIPDKSTSASPDLNIVIPRMEMEGFLLVPSKT